MIKNMGTIDRILRVAVAVIILILALSGTINGTLAIVLSIFGVVFLITSFIGTCPLYIPLKMSTCKKKE